MKTTCLSLIAALAFATGAGADTIAQWNFNSVPPDGTSNTGTNATSAGTGTIAVIGGVIQNANASQEYSSAAGSSDPATTDDSAYHTRNYAAQGEGNKTSGIEVHVSTVGYESIVVSWDHRSSPAASKFMRFQYSIDGSTFVDYSVMRMDAADTFVNGRTVNLTPIVGANQNPNFAFRLVSEFENTATGSGNAGYVATGAVTYSQNGTMRFDMLTISGSLPDGNAFPTITSIPNQTSRVDTVIESLPFQVGDAETPATDLIVNAISSHQAVVSDAGMVIEGTDANRTITIQPNFDAVGITTITLWVIDGGSKSNSSSFVLTVLPNNTAPSLPSVTNVHTVVNTPFAPIDLAVSDLEDNVTDISTSSSDETVIPNANILIIGAGANRTLNITPSADQHGNAVVTVTATDAGGLTATRTFSAMVVRSSEIVLSEAFNYADGPLVANSARLWTTRAGTPNQMGLVFGDVLMMGSQDEDVTARLIGGPYDTSGSTVLYGSFNLTCIGLPRNTPQGNPDIFAHLSGVVAGDLRGRVLISTNNVTPGFFRLGVANGGVISSLANVAHYPVDLSLDTLYQVVVGYDVAAGSSRLWVNPASGGAPVSAIDTPGPIAINAFGLRQSGGIGDMRIDSVLVGLSFEAVTPNLTRVRVRRNGDVVEVYWPSDGVWDGFILQSTPSLANPDWQPVQEASSTDGVWDTVTITEPIGERYFRLVKP